MLIVKLRIRPSISTYSFCMALTTALEKGAELVFALIVAAKERLSVGKNMQLMLNVACA